MEPDTLESSYAHAATIEKPQPVAPSGQKVKAESKEMVESYKTLAQKLGFNPLQLKNEEFKLFLKENNIPIYDYNHVLKYLNELVDQSGSRKSIVWSPLRQKERDAILKSETRPINDRLNSNIYQQIVPLSVLQTIEKINDAFPDAQFFVSEITNIPDPFLAVGFAGLPLTIVDFWAEPGFKPQ